MQNANRIKARLSDIGLKVYGGNDAPYLWVQTPDGMTSWRFFEQMLYGAHVVCTPGVGFGPSGEGFVRLTAFASHEQTDEALDRIARFY
jgi:LL-diaminopimelate aminotransferase